VEGELTVAEILIPDPVNPGPTPVVVGAMTPTATISGTPTVSTLVSFASSTGLTSAAAANSSVLLGSGASGAGAAYREIALGLGLAMSGTTLATSAVEYLDVTAGGTVALSSTATVHFLNSGATTPITLAWTATTPHLGDRVIVGQFGTGGVVSVAYDTSGTKIYNVVQSAPTPIAYNGSAEWIWINSLWVLLRHEQGAWIAPVFSASDFTGTGSMTWTVPSASVTTRYRLRGREITYAFVLSPTTVGGTGNTQLLIGPGQVGGFTPVASGISYAPLASWSTGPAYVTALSTGLGVSLVNGSPWPAGSTFLVSQLTFEVT
jgi:hypothetical protein